LHQKQQGKESGAMVLFFGCRHPNQDYIYNEELEHFVNEGVLTNLYVAFSELRKKKFMSNIKFGKTVSTCGI